MSRIWGRQSIADDITTQILLGRRPDTELTEEQRQRRLPPGAVVPGKATLARMYQVSESTAEAALVLLRDRGLVVGRQGKDIRVASPDEPGRESSAD